MATDPRTYRPTAEQWAEFARWLRDYAPLSYVVDDPGDPVGSMHHWVQVQATAAAELEQAAEDAGEDAAFGSHTGPA